MQHLYTIKCMYFLSYMYIFKFSKVLYTCINVCQIASKHFVFVLLRRSLSLAVFQEIPQERDSYKGKVLRVSITEVN